MVVMYLSVFGITVKMDNKATSQLTNKCSVLKTPTLQSSVNFPIIEKEMMEDKEYVIRVLIKHIRDQNKQMVLNNSKINEVFVEYAKCTGR